MSKASNPHLRALREQRRQARAARKQAQEAARLPLRDLLPLLFGEAHAWEATFDEQEPPEVCCQFCGRRGRLLAGGEWEWAGGAEGCVRGAKR